MKALLICPEERSEVEALTETMPLVNLCVLGRPFIYYWLEHLAAAGAKEVKILATDRPNQVREIVGTGARWGLRVEVIPESLELSCPAAREKYCGSNPADWMALPNDSVLMDHLPGCPERKIFESYEQYFSAIQFWSSQKPAGMQIGMKEIQPGVWVGMRTQISPQAKLFAPVWIGENVLVKPDAEIGPRAILENGVVVENAATISESWVGSQTFVGNLTQVQSSLALGNTLINFRRGSVAKIPDEFLLCALKDLNVSVRSGNWIGRIAALFALIATFPFALITICRARIQGQRSLRPRRAAAPQMVAEYSSSVLYFELANSTGWWKRWPQLWSVVLGEFTWVGNRPLTLIEAGKLTNEFERLWLASPLGLISQGDAEGCTDLSSDAARAHASFYAAQANWRLDLIILFGALKRLLRRELTAPPVKTGLNERTVELDRAVSR
ncbi:MAG: hypothetical protein ABIR24_06170 [Verrucomicrobiota bacterium]